MSKTNNVAKRIATILQAASNVRKGWIDNLPSEVREELGSIRHKWAKGEYSCCRAVLAKAIQQTLAEQGHQTPTKATISIWLKQEKP